MHARVGVSNTAATATALVASAAAGAALMYFVDPQRGRRRRHLVVDQLAHARAVADDAAGTTARDARNRLRGLSAEARTRFSGDHAGDDVLVERVRARLGRAVSHPGSIGVSIREGVVTLTGPVLSDELDALVSAVRAVRGVRRVENYLEPHESAGDVPGLQGGRQRAARFELAQENWAPAIRLAVGIGGGGLATYGARRGGVLGRALALAGAALATRAITNLPPRRLTGIGAGRRAVLIQKTITVDAPLTRVFEYLSDFEGWPAWMTHVRGVVRRGTVRGRPCTHWLVDGPAGSTVEWDALTTRLVPDREIAWKTIGGPNVEHTGIIQLAEEPAGGTRIDIKLSYNPPAGALGHVLATILGSDPKHLMDDDLVRLKRTIETGTPPRDAAQPGPSAPPRLLEQADRSTGDRGPEA